MQQPGIERLLLGRSLLTSGSRSWKGCCDHRLPGIPGSAWLLSGAALRCRRWTLARLGIPLRAPEWEDFEPEPERGLRRMFGGQQRHEAAVDAAERQFSRAQEDHQQREAERRRQVTQARRVHEQKVAEEEHEVAVHNARVDEMAAGLAANDRFAVSEYVQSVLDASSYPTDFPAERSAGYVPESSLLAVEWYLPPVEVIPVQKAFRHVKSRKVVEPVARPVAEIRQIYQGVIAQIALRTLREIFDSTQKDMISTVVFNGRVHAIDPLTGQKSSRTSSRCAPPGSNSRR